MSAAFSKNTGNHRKCAYNANTGDNICINDTFRKRNMCMFWNKLKKLQKTTYKSDISPETFASFYHTIMTDNASRTPSQLNIEKFVSEMSLKLQKSKFDCTVTPQCVEKIIRTLKRGVSPGLDGISTEYLYFGLCMPLCSVLSNLYSVILSTATVPDIFKTGLLIPILKKPTLDTNLPENYRPVSVSSVHSKLIEVIMKPHSAISDTQFGFQSGRGTSFVTCLLNDSI